ncbi:MAG: FtsX-like permease family protein [Candidatus Zixiibacteriota bacterium]
MLKNYIKIALKVLMRRKFFTFVSLFGITFTLLVLTIVISGLVHTMSPARPGSKLDRALFFERILLEGENTAISSLPSYHFLDSYIRPMTTPETMSFHSSYGQTDTYANNKKLTINIKYCDNVFWDILEFDFLEGRPFGAAEVSNADYVAVITDRTSEKIFEDSSPIGKYIETPSGNFRVMGVIRAEDITLQQSYADIYVPLTTSTGALTIDRPFSNYHALILARGKSDFPAIKEEFLRALDRAKEDMKGEFNVVEGTIGTQTDVISTYMFGEGSEDERAKFFAALVGLMILFMIFPAINLVNLNISRIIERSSEIGIRKAFGASSMTLVGQFIVENVILTLIGGAIAFVLASIILSIVTDSGLIPFGKFTVNLTVFLYSLLICLFFGLLSGVLPAWKMSRLHPVDALKGVEA